MKHTLTLILIVLAALTASAASSAEQLMARCAKAVNDAPSLTVAFTLSAGRTTSSCTMKIARQRFTMQSPDMTVWYDGTTQWTYIASDRELSITEPTADELLECNPFAIVNYYSQLYNVRTVAGQANTVELTPKRAGTSIRRATVTINPDTSLPSAINATLANGHTFSVKVTSASRGSNLPASTFVYNKTTHPAVITNDLR